MKRFTFTIALTFILAASAFGQTSPDPAGLLDLWSGYSFSEKMSGIETAIGTEDFEDDIIWGRSITLNGASGEFTANINRAGVKISDEYGNRIVGGTWTLHVYKGGLLRGMLFGEFTGGIIEWLKDKQGNIIAEAVSGNLLVTGGTGAYETMGGPHTSGIMTTVSELNQKGFPVHAGSVSLVY